jgi:glycosyltransferase involved in cell wall biosynthesis
MTIRILMHPNPLHLGDRVSGIHTVIKAYAKILPKHGITFVDYNEAYDIMVAHAGIGGAQCDVAMLHGIYFTDDYHAQKNEWRANEHVIESVRHCRVVTVPSEWVAETLRRDFRIDPIIIPHGVFLDEWKHNEQYVPKTVLWAKNRDYDVCDPTPLNDIAKRLPDFAFFTTFAAPKSPRNVIQIGVQPHEAIKKWIAKSSMIISTVKETWGIIYAEALASGTPVVTADYGHVPNLVEHGVSGYVYNRRNLDDIAYGIRWVDQHRAVLSANARKQASKLGWQETGQRIERVARLVMDMKQREVDAAFVMNE